MRASVLFLLAAISACRHPAAESRAPSPRGVQEERPATTISARGTTVQSVRPPSVVPLRNRQVLVYELAITLPAGGVPFSIDRIDVLDGSRALTSVDAATIAAAMVVRGIDTKVITPPPSTVGAGQAAVVFLMHDVPKEPKLLVNVTLRYTDGKTEVAVLDLPLLPVLPVVLGAPLRGGPWLAINGVSNTSIHRRAVPPFPNVYVPERYAIDYLMADEAGRIALPPGEKNEDHFAFGKDLLAVGDGTIHAVLDGLPDNPPGTGPAVVTRENIAGNMVTLALDGGAYVLYAHIKLGTVKVKLGARVKKGDVLGLLGNSGNSSAAHLHIHVSDRPDPLESEGVPFVFDSFSYVGKIGDVPGGSPLEVAWTERANEPQKGLLPAEDEATSF
jgi:hypothetical protein